jgi:hypothetical protein
MKLVWDEYETSVLTRDPSPLTRSTVQQSCENLYLHKYLLFVFLCKYQKICALQYNRYRVAGIQKIHNEYIHNAQLRMLLSEFLGYQLRILPDF